MHAPTRSRCATRSDSSVWSSRRQICVDETGAAALTKSTSVASLMRKLGNVHAHASYDDGVRAGGPPVLRAEADGATAGQVRATCQLKPLFADIGRRNRAG
jgi:hypothetical protein